MRKKFKVFDRKTNKLLGEFPTRKDAVWFCMINQKSKLPDGEWEDDYYIL